MRMPIAVSRFRSSTVVAAGFAAAASRGARTACARVHVCVQSDMSTREGPACAGSRALDRAAVIKPVPNATHTRVNTHAYLRELCLQAGVLDVCRGLDALKHGAGDAAGGLRWGGRVGRVGGCEELARRQAGAARASSRRPSAACCCVCCAAGTAPPGRAQQHAARTASAGGGPRKTCAAGQGGGRASAHGSNQACGLQQS